MEGIPDKKLLTIAKAIGNNEKLLALVLELKFNFSDFQNFKETNHSGAEVNSSGTTNMLFSWRERMKKEDQVRQLYKALEKVGLVKVAEDHLTELGDESVQVRKQESTPTTTDQPQPVKSPSRTRINQYVSEVQLEKISRKFPNENFTSFSMMLGIGATESNNILTKHCKDYRKALMEILMMWKNRTSGPCTELEDALRDSDAGDLIENILHK